MKFFKGLSAAFAVIIFSGVTLCAVYYFAVTSNYSFSEEKLLKTNKSVVFYDRSGNKISPEIISSESFFGESPANKSGEENVGVAELNANDLSADLSAKKLSATDLSSNAMLANAFIAVEDKRFYSHNGVDIKALLRALKNDILSGGVKEGGSTITQQLIKNTHLSGEKTLARKLRELKLTLQAEKSLSKKQILNYYLSTIYFGEGLYGVNAAAKSYFNKSVKELNLNECAALAATVKSPAYYNPRTGGSLKRKDLVLSLMKEQGLITRAQFSEFYGVKPKTYQKTGDFSRYLAYALSEAYDKCNLSPYGDYSLEIHTYYDQTAAQSLKTRLADYKTEAQAAIITADGEIIADVGNAELKRSPASAIKPILVYAPALDSKTVTLATRILNERADFSGYNPRNYGDEYGGYESVLTSIKNSLNVPAVKVLNAVGVKKAAEYAKKAGVTVTDLSLASALGAIGEGVSVSALGGAYTCFLNGGNYYEPSRVKSLFINGKRIFNNKKSPARVFSAGAAELINEALSECVKSGTARALNGKTYELCAKTGTNGDKNGNDDAVITAYTAEHVICLRLSALSGEKLPSYVTGGYAASYASQILNDIYAKKTPKNFKKSNETVQAKICKIAYEDGKIMLADDAAPEKYVLKFSFLRGSEPTQKSTALTCPQIARYFISVENQKVKIIAERKNHVKCKIIRISSGGAQTAGVLDCGKTEFYDENLSEGSYSYVLIPYCVCGGAELYGEEINAGSVIIYDKTLNGEWWNY